MFNFSSTERRICLINYEGLQIFALDDQRLIREGNFADDDRGYREFRKFLSQQAITPMTLVVDSAAEDFIVEKVAHVSPLDRKALLERKLEQHFRGIEYRSAKVLGRETSGRRDDRILFSAITQDQIIKPWVNILLQEEFPIKSVTTPAFAFCKVARELGLNTGSSILLVNWQRTGIRQSYIVDEKLVFSRLTPLPTDPDANLAKVIIDACSQSKDYLERIGLIKFNDKLDVHVVSPMLDDEDFRNIPGIRNFTQISHHNSIDLMPIDRYGGAQDNITAILLCLDWGVREGEFGNIYASSSVTRFMRLHKTATAISVVTIAVVLLSLLVSAPEFMSGLRRSANYDQLSIGIAPARIQYDELRAQFPETPIPSEAMELAVQTYDAIVSQSLIPSDIFVSISQVISAFPTIELTNLNWRVEPEQADDTIRDALFSRQLELSVEITGSLLGSRGFQSADNRLRQLIAALSQIEGVHVTPLQVPVEPGPFAEVNTKISDDVMNGQFLLRLRVET